MSYRCNNGYIWAVVFHKQSGNAVGIVVVGIVALDIAHFHIIEINICDICSLEAIFDSVNEVLLHIGMQQFALLSPFSHLGLMSVFFYHPANVVTTQPTYKTLVCKMEVCECQLLGFNISP